MTTVCSWCHRVIAPGHGGFARAQFLTYSICAECRGQVDEEIAAAERRKLTDADVVAVPCSVCHGEGSAYKATGEPGQRRVYVRCAVCGLTWETERR